MFDMPEKSKLINCSPVALNFSKDGTSETIHLQHRICPTGKEKDASSETVHLQHQICLPGEEKSI